MFALFFFSFVPISSIKASQQANYQLSPGGIWSFPHTRVCVPRSLLQNPVQVLWNVQTCLFARKGCTTSHRKTFCCLEHDCNPSVSLIKKLWKLRYQYQSPEYICDFVAGGLLGNYSHGGGDHDELPENVDHFFLLIMSIIIFFMQCGFAFMEAGAVR